MADDNLSPSSEPVPCPTLGQAFRVWCRAGILSFGGPAGQIALMHGILVEEKQWISEHRFLHALNYCMLLPGPEAQQLATYIGWLLHKARGGVILSSLLAATHDSHNSYYSHSRIDLHHGGWHARSPRRAWLCITVRAKTLD
jgi:hypothetical protein